MLRNIMKTTLLVVTLCTLGCSNPVFKPPVMEEYEQPYVLAPTYQALPVGVTQQNVQHKSDIVLIKQDAEYVYWTRSTLPLSMVKGVNEVLTHTDIIETPIVDTKQLVELGNEQNFPSRTCKKIFCDLENKNECGAIAWCGNDYCDKDKELSTVYDCSGEHCIAKYAKTVLLDSGDCTGTIFTIHPSCMGKGDQACVNHPELFHCNNLAQECKE